MYDRAATRPATERLWAGIAARLQACGIPAPEALSRPTDLVAHWLSPDLLLSHSCGLIMRAVLGDRVRLVGTPDFGLPGCPPGHYNSVVIARPGADRTTLADRTLAYNEPLSQSGYAVALAWAADQGARPRALVETGSHAGSVAAVAEGRADWATIDAQTWRLLQREGGPADTLAEIDRTAPRPGTPLITAAGRDPAPLAAAARSAIADLSAEDRATLGLRGLIALAPEAYTVFHAPPSPAAYAQETGQTEARTSG